MFEWDRLYLGGGNSSRVEQRDLLSVGGSILVVPNSAGIVGGVRAWDLEVDAIRQPMSASGRPNLPRLKAIGEPPEAIVPEPVDPADDAPD